MKDTRNREMLNKIDKEEIFSIKEWKITHNPDDGSLFIEQFIGKQPRNVYFDSHELSFLVEVLKEIKVC
jgi:hypothetical protein